MIFFTCAQIFVCKIIIKLSLFSLTPLAMFLSCYATFLFNFMLLCNFILRKEEMVDRISISLYIVFLVCMSLYSK